MAAMNRVQFQAGMSFTKFLERFGTLRQCESAVERCRWPGGYVCPCCTAHSKYYVVWHGVAKTFQCKACRYQTTLTSGTIFHSSKLPLTNWFQAMYMLTQSKNNVSALELSRLIGVCYRTAWRIKHKILEVMSRSEADRLLGGSIEVDDAYLGGVKAGGKCGRGSENKVPFIAAVQIDDRGRPQIAVFSRVKTFARSEVSKWAACHVAPESTVISDGLNCFTAVTDAKVNHMQIVVGEKRKSTSMACFRWINTIIANLKTATKGTYHSFGFQKYGFLYLAEAQYRFNRRFDLSAIMDNLIRDSVVSDP